MYVEDELANLELRVRLASREGDVESCSRLLESASSAILQWPQTTGARLSELRARHVEMARLCSRRATSENSGSAGSSVSVTIRRDPETYSAPPEGFREPIARAAASEVPSAEALSLPVREFWQTTDLPMPAFRLLDPEGAVQSSSQWSGRVLFVNFWATWCAPCILEMPHIEELAARFPDRERIAFLALSIDAQVERVAPEIRRRNWMLPALLAESYFAQAEPGEGVPFSWIVDRDGRIVATSSGLPASQIKQWESEAEGLLEQLLEAGPKPD